MADSKKIDDGGPAFSGGLYEPQHGGSNDRDPMNPGMSLRDWFAGQALISLTDMAGDDGYFKSDQQGPKAAMVLAKMAYLVADAMIAARKAGA